MGFMKHQGTHRGTELPQCQGTALATAAPSSCSLNRPAPAQLLSALAALRDSDLESPEIIRSSPSLRELWMLRVLDSVLTHTELQGSSAFDLRP